MGKIIISLLRKKSKKYLAFIIGIAVCFLFIIIIDTIYLSSSMAQLENAYSFEGKWDVCVKVDGSYRDSFEKIEDPYASIEAIYDTTYNLRLDKVPEDQKNESIDYVDFRYLAVHGINKDQNNILKYKLIEGRYPEKEDEIVIPSSLQYQGRAADKGTIKIGDCLLFTYGRRIGSDGMYTQGNVNGEELFVPYGEKEYTVCGIIAYSDYHTEIFTLDGYVGMAQDIDYYDREFTIYYKLREPSTNTLQELYQILNQKDGVINVTNNAMVVTALESMESSDYMRTIHYGVLIFEILLACIGFSVVVVEEYQCIIDDKILISRLYSLGAEKKQLSFIYGVINSIVLLSGYLLSFGISLICLYIVGEKSGIAAYKPNYVFLSVLFMILLTITTLILYRFVISLIPQRKTSSKTRKTQNQQMLTSLWKLAANNCKSLKIRCKIKDISISLVLICAPLFLTIFVSAYSKSKDAEEFYPFDYGIIVNSQTHNDIDKSIDKELDSNPYIQNYFWNSWQPRKITLEKECFPSDIYKYCSSGIQQNYFEEDDNYHGGVYLCFINKDYYNYINELNNRTLPPYEEFENSNNSIIWAECFLPENNIWNYEISKEIQPGKWVSFGNQIADYYNTISLSSWLDGYENVELNVVAYIDKSTVSRDKEGGFDMRIYVPEQVYYKYCKENGTHIQTEYCITGYNNSLSYLETTLNEMKKHHDMAVYNMATERELLKENSGIQLITSIVSILSAYLMCLVSIIVLIKIDLISRMQSYTTFKLLGIEKKEIFAIQLFENLISFSNALLISLIFHCVGAYTFFRSIYEYYGITLKIVISHFIPTCIGIMLLLIVCSAMSTLKLYSQNKRMRKKGIE